MSNLDKAREWAKEGKDIYSPGSRIKAVIDIILSLPDQWVDANEVRELLDRWASNPFPSSDEVAVLNDVEALIAPKRPTLAELIEQGNDPEQYRWMQARLEGSAFDFVISDPGIVESMLWAKGGTAHIADNSLITPLPDLPKLQWPGGVVDCEIVDETPDDQQSNTSETPKSSIKPEDVPANEPWLLEIDGNQCIGTRLGVATARPWSVAALNGSHAFHVDDSEITLIHKLVPETHALPEGMRLADHKECGRVVVSQRADKDGNYKVFCSISSTVTGDDWWYAHKNELTFLDGNQ